MGELSTKRKLISNKIADVSADNSTRLRPKGSPPKTLSTIRKMKSNKIADTSEDKSSRLTPKKFTK